MTTIVLRKKLHGYIDTMPERNLSALKPLLSVLAEPLYTIEPADKNEIVMVEKRMKNASDFVPWNEVKHKLKAKNGKRIKA
jgi:hypothetical protein